MNKKILDMEKDKNDKVISPARHVIRVEATGIVILILFVWTLELIDLPNLAMGNPQTPINYAECIGESVMLLLVGAVIITFTRRLLNRLKYLEGLLHICSFCKKIKVGEEWIALEQYISARTEAVFSHGFCPECGEKHYKEYLNPKKQLSE